MRLAPEVEAIELLYNNAMPLSDVEDRRMDESRELLLKLFDDYTEMVNIAASSNHTGEVMNHNTVSDSTVHTVHIIDCQMNTDVWVVEFNPDRETYVTAIKQRNPDKMTYSISGNFALRVVSDGVELTRTSEINIFELMVFTQMVQKLTSGTFMGETVMATKLITLFGRGK
jgi:hypothetical protein